MATKYNTRNVIVGAAALFLSTVDSTEADWFQAGDTSAGGPDLPDNAPFAGAATTRASYIDALAASDSWRSVGMTTGGISVNYDPTYDEIEVDQLLDAAKIFKSKMTFSVQTSLAEATLENLLIAWGQSANTLRNASEGDGSELDDESSVLGISSGNLGDDPVERALVFVGPSPRSATGQKRERIYHLRRALQVESSEHSLSRNEASVIPTSFRCLPDPSYQRAEYGVVVDRVLTK